MPYPTQPSITVVATSTTSCTVTISGTDAGSTNHVYYRLVGSEIDTTAGTRTGDGTFPVTNLILNGQYLFTVVSDNGSSYSLPALYSVSLAQTDLVSTAFHTLFEANGATVALIPGGLWTGEVPEGTALPYVWMDLGQFNSHPTFPSEWEYGRVVLYCYAVGAQAAEQCTRQLKATFDYKHLPYASVSHIACWPKSYKLTCEMIRDKTGHLVYRSTLLYDIINQRPR